MFRTWVRTQVRDGEATLVHRLFGGFQNGTNVWFAARAGRNELPGYLEELDIARGLADQEARSDLSASAVALQARYALILGTLHELADNIAPAVARRLVEVGT